MGLKLQQRTDTRQHLLQNSENSGTKEHRKGTSRLGTVMADIQTQFWLTARHHLRLGTEIR